MDSQGNTQWSRTFQGNISLAEASSLVQTPDGGYALAGWTYNSTESPVVKFWLLKVDSAGNAQWNQTYGSYGYQEAHCLVQAGDGGFALAGFERTTGSNYSEEDFYMVKLDDSGNVQWEKTYPSTYVYSDNRQFNEEANCLIATEDGGYALAGVGGFLVKTDSKGQIQWNQTYGTYDYGVYIGLRGIIQDADQGFTLVNENFTQFKVDSSGNEVWNQSFSGYPSQGNINNYVRAQAMVRAGNAGYVIVGYNYNEFPSVAGSSNQLYNQHYLLVRDDPPGSASQTSPTSESPSVSPSVSPTATSTPNTAISPSIPEFPTAAFLSDWVQ